MLSLLNRISYNIFQVGDKKVVSRAQKNWKYIGTSPLLLSVIESGSPDPDDSSPSSEKSTKTTSSASEEIIDTTSDWFSSLSLSAVSGNEKSRHNQIQVMNNEQLIADVINQRVMEHLPLSEDEETVCTTPRQHSLDLVDCNCSTNELKQLVNGNMDLHTDDSSNSTLELNDNSSIATSIDSSLRVKRPRNHQSIMAEAREKKEMAIELGFDTPDGQRVLFENRQAARKEIINRVVNAQTMHQEEQMLRDGETSDMERSESVVSEDDDRRITIQAGISSKVVTNGESTPQDLYTQLNQGLPMVMLPSQGPEVALLLQALKQSEGEEASKLVTPSRNYEEKENSFNSDSDQTELKQINLARSQLNGQKRYEVMAHDDGKIFNETKPIDHSKPKHSDQQMESFPIGSNMNNLQAKSADRVLERNYRQEYSRLHRAISPDSFTVQSPRASSENSHSQDGSYEPQRRDLTSPGRQPDQPDPSDGLVKVLSREVEILKLKINAMEKRSITETHQAPMGDISRVIFGMDPEQSHHQRHHNPDTPHRHVTEDSYRESPEYVKSHPTRENVQSRFVEKAIGNDDSLPQMHLDHKQSSAHLAHSKRHHHHEQNLRYMNDTRKHRSSSSPASTLRGSSSSILFSYRSRSVPGRGRSADDMVLNHQQRAQLQRETLSAGATPVRGRSPIVIGDLSKEIPIQDDNGQLTFSSPRSRPISLGYSSPVAKVPQEIWGSEAEYLKSIHPQNQEKLRKLLARVELGDGDIIELKQALATAITENDILQAKLNNANTEITEKMSKTSEVLNECRSHLAKTQAENAELRNQLEKERNRADALEARIRELESTVSTTKADNDDLEAELEGTVCLLKGATRQDVTVLKSLQDEIHHLRKRFDVVQKENTTLREASQLFLHIVNYFIF